MFQARCLPTTSADRNQENGWRLHTQPLSGLPKAFPEDLLMLLQIKQVIDLRPFKLPHLGILAIAFLSSSILTM